MLPVWARSLTPCTEFVQISRRLCSAQPFRELLADEGAVVTDPATLHAHNTDWTGRVEGASKVLLKPGSTTDVSRVLQHCSKHRISVVPQGGNTGLARAATPLHDEVILNLARLNQIYELAPGGVVVCGAGCTLAQLNEHVWQSGYVVPLDLGPKDVCQIGGNLASNAGGLRFLRYGSLRGSVTGVEAVLADGTVLDCLKTVRKDNTGYDLKQLFIGSEGTLGIITKVAIQCAPRMSHTATALFAISSFADVVAAHTLARQTVAQALSAFEFLDAASMDLAVRHVPDARRFFDAEHAMYILVELAGSSAEEVEGAMAKFSQRASEQRLAVQEARAASADDVARIWRMREGVSKSLQIHGTVYKYDLSLPLDGMYELVEAVRQRLHHFGPAVAVTGYGHVGDGNLHLNVADGTRAHGKEILAELEPFVYEWTRDRRGSVSAEHGIGALKQHVLHMSQSQAAIALMRQLKQMMDPHGVLNPGKVLPPP